MLNRESAHATTQKTMPIEATAFSADPAGSFFLPFFLNGASFVKPVGAAPESRSCVSLLTGASHGGRCPGWQADFGGALPVVV